MVRVGIPNRSSFLHASAIVQCASFGFLNFDEYHPAKLYYSTQKAEIILTRSESLCCMLERGRLDAIFTGGDYAEEFITKNYDSVPVKIFNVSYALIGASMAQNLDASTLKTIYTKFPKTAHKYLERWGVPYEEICAVGGGTEAFVCMGDGLAFDVVCSGISVSANRLAVLRQSEPIEPVWLMNSTAHELFQSAEISAKLEQLVPTLRGYCESCLSSRDHELRAKVVDLLPRS